MVAVALFCLTSPVMADPFGLSGNWNYQKRGGDEIETSSSFNQSYNLNFAKELTAAMNVSAAARYNENRPSEGSSSDSINPSASFDLRNDIFSLNLSGSENRLNSEGTPPFVSRSWGANLYSQVEDSPNLRLSYSESRSYDDQRVHQQNAESSDFGASLEHSLASFDLLYDFGLGTSEDLVADTTGDTESHFARVKFSESFFQGRLSFAATQQYSANRSETTSPTGPGMENLQPITILAASSADDNSPTTGTLDDKPALIDRDPKNSAGVVIDDPSDVQNLGLQVIRQPVDRIRVIFDDEVSPADRALLSWEVYKSDDAENWSEIPQVLAISYVVENGRSVALIDIPEPVKARHIKAVVSAVVAPSADLIVTEVEAGTRTSEETVEIEFVSHQTQASLGFRPAIDWFMGYNLRRVLNQPEGGPENTQLSQSVNLSYSPSRLFSTSLGISESRDETDGSDERIGRSYSLSMNSAPLSTLDLSMGYTRSDSYEADRRESTSDSVNGTLTATIFPDLSASLTPTWSRSETLETEAETTTYGMNLTSSARLTPKLDLNINGAYSRSTTDEGSQGGPSTSTSSKQYGATLNYRPSDILLLNGSISRDSESNNTPFSGNVAWLCTRKIQTNAGVSLDLSQGNSEQYNASVNWSINRHISLQGSGGYQVGEEEDTWNLATSLNATY